MGGIPYIHLWHQEARGTLVNCGLQEGENGGEYAGEVLGVVALQTGGLIVVRDLRLQAAAVR